MLEGTPSRTAMRVAQRRAAHQVLDRPLVLDDPIALRIVEPDYAQALRDDPQGAEQSRLDPYFRAFMAVRSRFAEDMLAAAVKRGVRQYVLLGAGLDTFAYRNPYPELRVFEVDFPATQQWKRYRLDEGGIAVPASLTFAPVDFEHQTLAQGLADAGFDRAAPAQFTMLGVVPYLTLDALDSTWGFVGSGAKGSGLVFDYSIPPELMGPIGRRIYQAMAERVAAAGEPFKTAFVPEHLQRRLRGLGFSTFDDLSGDEINARYFSGRGDGLKVGASGRLMSALT